MRDSPAEMQVTKIRQTRAGNATAVRSVLLGVATAFALTGEALAQTHFVYTNDDQSPTNTVTTYSVAPDGSLTNLGQTATAGSGCGGGFTAQRRNRISHNGDLLLVADNCSNDISVFSGASTGKPVLRNTLPFSGTVPFGVSISSDGKCIVTAASNIVSSFLYPTLTLVNSVTVTGSVGLIDDMKIGKPGPSRYVAAALIFDGSIAVIPLSPNTCTLGAPTYIATAGFPAGVDFSPNGNILYTGEVGNSSNPIVEAFAFPAGTPEPRSPYPTAGSSATSVLASKDGLCLFVSDTFSGVLTSIHLNDGIPSTSGTNFPAVGPGALYTAGLANDITGKMFYVASTDGLTVNYVTTEIINNGCTLTESPSGPVNTGVSTGAMLSLTAFP